MVDDILHEVALNHFAERGVDGALCSEIAIDAGLETSELEASFASVDKLFDCSVAAAVSGLCDDLTSVAEGEQAAAAKVLLMVRRLATPTRFERVAMFVVVREFLGGNVRALRVYNVSLRAAFALLLRMIGEAQFCAQVVPLPPRFLLSVLLSGVVLPQIIGYGEAEGLLGGIFADDVAAGATGRTPQSSLLAASLEAVFGGLLNEPIDLGPTEAVH